MPSLAASGLTQAHRVQQRQIGLSVVREVLRAWGMVDTRDIDRSWPLIAELLGRIIDAGHARSVATAADYLKRHALLDGVDLRQVSTAPRLPAEQVSTALRVTGPVALKRSFASEVAVEFAADRAGVKLAGAASRLVLSGGRTTIDETVSRSSQITGYRRVGSGSSCYWCAMLISRGSVYKNEATGELVGASGRRRGTQQDGEAYHDHCDCTAEPLYRNEPEPPEVRDLARRYQAATAGLPAKEAVKAWRAAYEAA